MTKKSSRPGTVYFVVVKDDEGNLKEWSSKKSQKEAEAQKIELEETRGYEGLNIEVKPVSASLAINFTESLMKSEREARDKQT